MNRCLLLYTAWENLGTLLNVIPTNPFVLEQGKDAKLYTKKELYYQFDKLDYFLEMMKTGKYSIIAFGI